MASESSDEVMNEQQAHTIQQIQTSLQKLQDDYEHAHIELRNATMNIEHRMTLLQTGQQQVQGKTAQIEIAQSILEKITGDKRKHHIKLTRRTTDDYRSNARTW